jgi:ABC-type phosphate transport system substrate-binding protein
MSQYGSNANKSAISGALIAVTLIAAAILVSGGGGSATNLAAVTTSSQRLTFPNSSSPTSVPSTTGSASPNESPPCATGPLTLVGSTAFEPIAQQAALQYMQDCPGATITVNDGDSAYGMSQVLGAVGSSDAGSMIAMYDGIYGSAKGLIPHAIGYVISPLLRTKGLFPASGLSTGDLRTIFVQFGRKGVVAVGRRAGSGSRKAFFTNVLNPNSANPVPAPYGRKCPNPPTGSAVSFTSCTEDSTTSSLDFVNGTPNAIGYAETYGLLNGYPQVSEVKIDGFAPRRDNVLNGNYKFWAVEHLYAAISPTALATDFLTFLPGYIESNPTTDFITCADAPNTLESDCHSATSSQPSTRTSQPSTRTSQPSTPTSQRPTPTSQPPKPGKSALLFDILSIGSWCTLGIGIIWLCVAVPRWILKPRAGKRPWWQWLGWALALVAIGWATAWSVYFLGIRGVIPVLAPIVASLIGYWWTHRSRPGTPVGTGPGIATPVGTGPGIATPGPNGEPDPTSAQESAVREPLSENSQKNVTDPNWTALTISDLEPTINIISGRLRDKTQIDLIVSMSNLQHVRWPITWAEPWELWTPVFDAALDESHEKFELLCRNIRKKLGARSEGAFEDALRELGLFPFRF